MVRKTKAELAAEREAEQARLDLQCAEQYPPRLMSALEEATQKNNYELTVKNGMFSLRDRNESRAPAMELTYHYNVHSYNELESLEWDLRSKAEEQAEAERRYAVKQAALAKLTEEERKLLGLY